MDDGGRLRRILFGKGYFGAANAFFGSDFANATMPELLNEVFTLWHKPAKFAGMDETMESPGGRLLICTRESVLWDSARPVRYQAIQEPHLLGWTGRRPVRPMPAARQCLPRSRRVADLRHRVPSPALQW